MKSLHATLYTDGGSRGNPGPAAYGYVLQIGRGKPVEGMGYLRATTNNVAEYTGLVRGLARALKAGVTDLACFLDSELVVKQMRGEYRIKDAKLLPLYQEAQAQLRQFNTVTFAHVPREKNKRADKLVNQAIDMGEHAND
jgi:ribonuclease HI